MRKKELIGLDVDSTIIDEEGLNWLAERKGVGQKVAKLTADSMNGLVSVEEVMPLKMDIIRPSRSDMEALSREYLAHLSQDAVAVVQELKRAGKHVVIITGNFHEAVDPVAKTLGLNPKEDVYANTLSFDGDGNYQGFIENHRLMHEDGKKQVIEMLRQRYGKITHVGDSMGDRNAGADIFIGYGGAAMRTPVVKESDFYISSPSLAPILAVGLSRRQLRKVQDRNLVERANTGLLVRQGRRCR